MHAVNDVNKISCNLVNPDD